MPAVFISYSRRDKDFVARLHEALSARQYDVWVDWEDIPPVAQWFDEIRTGVGKADGFVYVISPESVESEVCTRELAHAVEQRKRIVPIVRRDAEAAQVPEAAAELNWIFLRDGDDFDHGLQQLVGAIEKDLEHVRTHTHLGVAANRWNSSGHESSQLLRGAELAAAESWLVAGTDKQPEATQLQREYVLASRQSATRRQRTVIAAITVALAITAVLAVVALIERSSAISARNLAISERNLAYARQLDADAQSVYPTDPELSVLLAEEAARVDPGTPTEQALREALAQSQVRVRYTFTGAEPGDAIWSPDGTRLLVTDPGVWARIYRPESKTPAVTLGGAPSANGQSGWDANGDRVVLGGGRPAVYNATSGRLIAHVPGAALFAALSPDGTRVVTVDLNSVGHVFDVATGRQLASFHPTLRSGATCMALSPDGSVVAQCDYETLPGNGMLAAVDTWSTSTGKLLHSAPSPSGIDGSVAFSPDGGRYVFTTPAALPLSAHTTAKQLDASIGADGTFVYDAHSGKLVIAFHGGASAATFSPITELPKVAYATTDGLGHVYSFASGIDTSLAGSSDVINSLRFNGSGTDIVAGSRDDVARVFDAANGGLPIETLAGHGGEVVSASFGLGDTAIATASRDGTVRVWATTTPAPSAQLALSQLPHGGDLATANIGFTADSARIVQTSATGQGQILSAAGLQVLARLRAPAGQGFAGSQATPDGRRVATLSGPVVKVVAAYSVPRVDRAELYDASDGRLVATLEPVSAPALLDGALNHSGTRLVAVGSDGSADVWSTQAGRLVYHVAATGTVASAGAFSSNGALLAIARYPKLPRRVTYTTTFGRATVSLYDAATGRLQRTIVGETIVPQEAGTANYAPLSLAFNPGATLIALGGADQGVEVYATATGKLVRRLDITGAAGGSYAASVAFSPNGKLLAAGAVSGTYVWHLPSYLHDQPYTQVPAGQTNGMVGASGFGVTVGFTRDSRYMVTAGDLTLAVWDPADHLQLFHDYPLAHGALSPDGQRIVTAGFGVDLYRCDLCTGLPGLLTLARVRTTRGFTPSERARYLQRH